MTPWQKLAEARIREWQRKPAAARDRGVQPEAAVTPLEMQLLEEVMRLHEMAAAAKEPATADALRRQATGVETRLLIVLESSGRPLAAQRFGALIQEMRSGAAHRGHRERSG